METKKPWESKGVVFGVFTLIGWFATMKGITIDASILDQLADQWIQLVGVITTIGAIYGRWKADRKISL